MTEIKPECQANAAGMLSDRFSKLVGYFNDCAYFIVDGTLFSHHANGAIHRCDDHEEQEEIISILRERRAK
jgi:hypothetical protein